MVLRRIQGEPILHRRSVHEKLLLERLIQSAPKPKVAPKLLKVTSEIVRHWHLQGLCQHNAYAKYMQKVNLYVMRLQHGTMYNNAPKFAKFTNRSFTIEQIKHSINNFATAALCSQYEPKNKTHMLQTKLHDFFLNQYVRLPNGEIGSSYFLQYLNTRPKRIYVEVLIKDEFPQITNFFKSWYKRVVLGGVETILPVRDENNFRTASIKTSEFYQRNKNKFVSGMAITPLKLAGLVCEAIQSDSQNKPYLIQPSWISSNTTFERRLPAYLSYQGVISSETTQFSIYSGGD